MPVFVGALFFSLASFLSTLFGDIWRPLLIAVFIACVAGIVQFAAPDLGVFKVMSGETLLPDWHAAVDGIRDRQLY